MKIDHYVEGLRSILEFADEMVIDIPRIWVYLGELISPMVEDGAVSLAFLRGACEPLLACDKAGIVVSQVLQETSHVIVSANCFSLNISSDVNHTNVWITMVLGSNFINFSVFFFQQ